MAKNDNLKNRLLNNLIRSLSDNTAETRKLSEAVRGQSRSHRDLVEGLRRSSSGISVSGRDFHSVVASTLKDVISKDLGEMNETLGEIRDILKDRELGTRHEVASERPTSTGGSSPNISGMSDSELAGEVISLAGKALAAVSIGKYVGQVIGQLDSSIATGKTIQQVSGMSMDQYSSFKSGINQQIGNSTTYSIQEETERMASVMSSLTMDSDDRLLKYVKPIASAVESMDLNIGTTSDILYTLEKRGTFDQAKLQGVIDTIYQASSANSEVTAEELSEYVATGVDFTALGDQANQDYATQVFSALGSTGLDNQAIKSMIQYYDQALLNPEAAGPLMAKVGISAQELRSIRESGNTAEGFEQFASAFINEFSSTQSDFLRQELLSEAGISDSFTVRNDLDALAGGKFQEEISRIISEGSELPTAEEGAENQFKDWEEKLTNVLGNFFTPLTDKGAEMGIGSGIVSGVSGLIGGLGGGALMKGAGKLFSKLFGSGATGATGAVDDVASLAANSADDVASLAANSADDLVAGVGGATGRASSVLGKIGKAAPWVAGALEGLNAIGDVSAEVKEGDKRGVVEESVEGVSDVATTAGAAFAGTKAGAAIGTAIGGPLGTVVGGLAGTLIGGIAGYAGKKLIGDNLKDLAGNAYSAVTGDPGVVIEDETPLASTESMQQVEQLESMTITKDDINEIKDQLQSIYTLLSDKFSVDEEERKKDKIESIVDNARTRLSSSGITHLGLGRSF